MFELEPNTTEFLTLETKYTGDRHYVSQEDRAYPMLHIEFVLGNKKITYARQAYTLCEIVQDVGGFNAAIIVFPAMLMSTYASIMYEQAITTEIPTRRRSSSKRRSPDQNQGHGMAHKS